MRKKCLAVREACCPELGVDKELARKRAPEVSCRVPGFTCEVASTEFVDAIGVCRSLSGLGKCYRRGTRSSEGFGRVCKLSIMDLVASR